jgi:tetratricopeptide (TPR) repeat protein
LQTAIQLGHPQADEFRRDIFVLMRDHLEVAPTGLKDQLEELLSAISTHRLDLRIWAVEERLELAAQLDELDGAEAFLASESAVFGQSDFEPQFEFLSCRLLADRGRDKEAEVRLRALRNQVEPDSDVSAMAGWLLGRILLRGPDEQHWKESLSFFTDVLQHGVKSPYAVASRLGQGEALARLQRHDEAIASYGAAIRQLGDIADKRVAGVDGVLASLAITAESLRVSGDLHHAVAYADLAARLSADGAPERRTVFEQPLALLEEQLADKIAADLRPDRALADSGDTDIARWSPEAAQLYAQAARRYVELADWNVMDEPRSSGFAWKSAELFARGGALGEAIEQFQAFLDKRPEDHRGPAALFRIGQLRLTRGELSNAADAFRECNERFPRSFDGARALVPLARTYMAMGSEHFEAAENALRQVLDNSNVFTPRAGEFVEGLFLLGDILERGGRYESAISTLQEAVDRYPGDPRVRRGQFLLGGSYRKSALAMRAESRESGSVTQVDKIRNESMRRFRAARDVYRNLINELESSPISELTELEQMYLRHSYLYEADCYFETQEYQDALKLYEQAAGNLRDSARGLSAHVQIINCHVFLGEPREARAALSRAMVVVNSMPDSAFAGRVAKESRSEWKAYFEWLVDSELF